MRITYALSLCFIGLTMVYLLQTVLCYNSLELATFDDFYENSDYAIEIYELTETICLVNIVHALCLLSLGSYVHLFTRKFKVLN